MGNTRLLPFALIVATSILISCGDESSVEPPATPAHRGGWIVSLDASPWIPEASASDTDLEIWLFWSDRWDEESGFEIQRSKGLEGPFSLIAKVKANVTQYLDSGLASDVEYCYRVRAFGGNGKNKWYSSYSAAACDRTIAVDPPSDPRPTNLTATSGSPGEIDLAWDDNWDSETNYAIERCVESTGGCFFYGLALVAANETTYTDSKDLVAGSTYCYRVKGLRMKGRKATYTEYSDVACAMP